jgi:hypothetical protein
MQSRIAQSLIVALAVFALAPVGLAAGPYVDIGLADPLAIEQPRVAVAVANADQSFVYGPDASNTWLLDTGAQGLIAGGTAYNEMAANGYTTVAQFNELGVAGTVTYDISEAYDFLWAGSDGAPMTLDNARLLSNPSANFGGFGGIVGMPAMMGRAVTMDLTQLVDLSALIPSIGVDFNTAVPVGAGHRYSIPLSMVDYPATHGQQNPDDPLPTYAPLPFLSVTTRHGSESSIGDYVLDTGAQLSIISTDTAFALGLDANNDGNFDDEAVAWQQLGGVGGTVVAPQVLMEEIAITTDSGVEIKWRELAPIILDIDPSIDGIFGSDLLTSGWLEPALQAMNGEVAENGPIEQIHFDFTPTDATASMVLDLNPVYDVVVPEPASLSLLALGGLAILRRRR